jgi:cystinosin
MVQHYILYRNYKDKSLNTVDEERRRLIIEGRVPRVDEEDDEYL